MAIRSYIGNKPPEIVFLNGTGIIENSWAPVREVLLRFYPKMPIGQENLAFATEIYHLRQFTAAYQGGIRLTGIKRIKDYFSIRRGFKEMMHRYYSLKLELSKSLITATDNKIMSINPIVEKIYEKWLKNNKSHVIITTNWDMMLETFFENSFVFHLHGDVNDHKTLYLPSEHSRESYHIIETKGRITSHNGRITHGNWLATGVKTLIISGLSLSPLDAELNSLLRCAADRRSIPEVIIIDPSPGIVYERLLFHTQNKISKVTLCKPADL